MDIVGILLFSSSFWILFPLSQDGNLRYSYPSPSSYFADSALLVTGATAVASIVLFTLGVLSRRRHLVKYSLLTHGIVCSFSVLYMPLSLLLDNGDSIYVGILLFIGVIPGAIVAFGILYALQNVRFREY